MDKDKRMPARSQRLTLAKLTPPDWFGWPAVAAMFLLPAVRIGLADGPWFSPLMSLGEWLLVPLGVLSLSMGFLSLARIREKTLLPLWLSAVVPALIWLAAMGLAILRSGVSSVSGDLFVSWLVHLVFPTMALLPLLTMRRWRNRLMWALLLGLAVNAVFIFMQGYRADATPPNPAALGWGGFLASQHDYGLMLAIALPLLAAWRGGHERPNAFAILLCTFLMPILCLAACFTASGLVAGLVGLAVAWAAWRSHAWILGVFLVLAVLGYGSGPREAQDGRQRRLLADSAAMGGETYRRALNVFQVRPFLGTGPESFHAGSGREPTGSITPTPWYATLLGGSGIVGLGVWAVLLAELAARAAGRPGARRCLWHGGVLGGTVGLMLAGFWTEALPEGAGALVGFLVAVSVLEEPEPAPFLERSRRRGKKEGSEPQPPPARTAAGRSGDTDVVLKGKQA